MLRRAGIAVAAFFLLTSIGLGQDNRYEISLSGGGRVQQAVHGQRHDADSDELRRYSGHRQVPVLGTQVRLNSTTRTPSNSQIYFASPLTYRIQNTIGEYSGAYVFSFHAERQELSRLFLRARQHWSSIPGYNFNTINGVQTYLPASQQTKPAFLYGGGLDYRIFSSLPFIRRSALTQSPGSATAISRTALQGARLQSAEPVYRSPRTHGGAYRLGSW